ncbi:hypothetical protein ACIBF6_08965 [Streptosporangium amethystogenes]|uniref:hypothetical protein n=1 Tax=Streptosporangium amethystogenes TaxID=2002 RepID=UPI0037A46AA4
MHNPSAPVLDRALASSCGCFTERPPLPMGCAVCGHAPYAHGCPGRAADHEYAQPSGELMAERLDVRHRLGLGQTSPTFQPAYEVTAQLAPVVPAPRQVEREKTSARTRPAGRTDARRPVMPGTGRPHWPVETREDRAARLALARDSLTRRRALIAARASETPPQNTDCQPQYPRFTEPAVPPPHTNLDHRKHVTPLVQRILTVLPDIPGTGDLHRTHQAPPPRPTLAPCRDHPDASSSWQDHPYRQGVAA